MLRYFQYNMFMNHLFAKYFYILNVITKVEEEYVVQIDCWECVLSCALFCIIGFIMRDLVLMTIF